MVSSQTVAEQESVGTDFTPSVNRLGNLVGLEATEKPDVSVQFSSWKRGFEESCLVENGELTNSTFDDELNLSNEFPSGGVSFGVRKGRPSVVRLPAFDWPKKQDPALTDITSRLINVLRSIVLSRALQASFPVERTVVSVFDDPIESDRKVVLQVICSASIVQTMAFWDSLERDLEDWLAILNEFERTLFVTKIGLRFNWQ